MIKETLEKQLRSQIQEAAEKDRLLQERQQEYMKVKIELERLKQDNELEKKRKEELS